MVTRTFVSKVIRCRSSGISHGCSSCFLSSVSSSAPQAGKRVGLTVPKDVAPGQRFIVKGKNGQSVTVVLPANTAPGQRFEFAIPLKKKPAICATVLNGQSLLKVNGVSRVFGKAPEMLSATHHHNGIKSDTSLNSPSFLSMQSLAEELKTIVDKRLKLLTVAREEVALLEASLESLKKHVAVFQTNASELSGSSVTVLSTDDLVDVRSHLHQMNGISAPDKKRQNRVTQDDNSSPIRTQEKTPETVLLNAAALEHSVTAEQGIQRPEDISNAITFNTTAPDESLTVESGVRSQDRSYSEESLFICYDLPRNTKKMQKKESRVEKKLMEKFSPYGKIARVKIPKLKGRAEMLKRNKRIAFVYMADAASAKAARKALDTEEFRVLPVYKDTGSRVFVGNLMPGDSTSLEKHIAQLLAPYGCVQSVDVQKLRRSKEYTHAYVEMDSKKSARTAINALTMHKKGQSGVEDGPSLYFALAEMNQGEERTLEEHRESIEKQLQHKASDLRAAAARTTKEEFFEHISGANVASRSKVEKQYIDEMVRRHALALTQTEFNTVLRAFAYAGEFNRCLNLCNLFENMRGFNMNGETYGYLITSNLKSSQFQIDKVLQVFERMKSRQLMPDIITVNKVLGTCWKYSNLAAAKAVWDKMPLLSLTPNRDSFRTIIGLFSQTFDVERVVQFMQEMEHHGLKPDKGTFSYAIRSCLKDTERARDFLCVMQQYGFKPTLIHYTELLHVYIRADRLGDVPALVAEMHSENLQIDDIFVTSWGNAHLDTGNWRDCIGVLAENLQNFEHSMDYHLSVMLTKLKKYKKWEESMELFGFFDGSTTGRSNVKGSHIVNAIIACGHLADWEQALRLNRRLEGMVNDEREISAGVSHFRQVSSTVKAARHFLANDRITVQIET